MRKRNLIELNQSQPINVFEQKSIIKYTGLKISYCFSNFKSKTSGHKRYRFMITHSFLFPSALLNLVSKPILNTLCRLQIL